MAGPIPKVRNTVAKKTPTKKVAKKVVKKSVQKAPVRSMVTTTKAKAFVAPVVAPKAEAKVAPFVAKMAFKSLAPTLMNFTRRFNSEGPIRETGTVKWFDGAKGFGFVTRPSGADLFVHFTNIQGSGFRTLAEGQTVEFTVGTTTKGPAALDVVGLEFAEEQDRNSI